MIVIKIGRSVRESRTEENTRAAVEKQSALLEYVAIMADVELPTMEESEGLGYEEI